MKNRVTNQIGLFLIGIFFIVSAYCIDVFIFPVVTSFNVSIIELAGDDVIVSGTLKKSRSCALLQDVQAFTSIGERLPIVFLDRKESATFSRPAIDGANQPFGPWLIKGGNNETFALYSLHRCHALWTKETRLATVTS